nr:4-coumarate--coa ligase-like 9 [Quercus suber]POF18149.1 4-coumarate--coa ligase-like 9 [Quercus suber]
MLTHWNLVASVAVPYAYRTKRESPAVFLYKKPYFHVFGFFYSLKLVAMSEVVVLMESIDLRKMLKAVKEFRVTHVAMAPPVVAAMAKANVTKGYDMSSLEGVACGATLIEKDVISFAIIWT